MCVLSHSISNYCSAQDLTNAVTARIVNEMVNIVVGPYPAAAGGGERCGLLQLLQNLTIDLPFYVLYLE